MSTIVTRAGKGSPLTNTEVDSNFTNLNTDKVESITSADGSVVVSSSGTTRDLSVGVAGSTATLISQVRNETGATLTKGTVVYISGAAGNKAVVSKALATGDSTSAQTYGMVQADIPHNQNGYVVVVGAVSGLNTSAFADGTQLYLSGVSAGGYTNTKPYAPTHLVYVGIVTYSHNTQGTIQVKIQNGYELDEIHDVSARSPVDGQTLVYVSSTGLWTKTDQASMSVGSAATLATARNINGVSFNGSADITVADATKLPLAGGTLSGKLTLDGRNEIYGVPTNAGTVAGFMGGTSGGTTAARTQSLNTQTLLNVAALGYTGSGWVGGAGLSFVATENITAANRGTKAVLTAIAAGDSVATTMEFNGSALTINGSTAVTSSNYNTYAPTKTGTGASGTWGINITGNAATATSATDSTKLPLAGGTLTGKVTFPSANADKPQMPNGFLGLDTGDANFDIWGISRDYYPSNATAANAWGIRWDGDSNQIRFIGGGSVRVSFDLDDGATQINSNTVLHAGNYNSYAPTLTGTGASGTWGISVTGNAATVTNGLYKVGTNAIPAVVVLNTTADNWMWQWASSGSNDWYLGPTTANFGIGGSRLAISSSGSSPNAELSIERGTTRLLEILQANLQYKGNVVLHAGNYNSYSPTLTGTGASGTWNINISGNAATATLATSAITLTSTQSNWGSTGVLSNVVGLLSWRNYGNSHVIFDASASLSPSGSAVDRTNAQIAWGGSYPTLMGWNGSNTYGVRVDSARVADSAGAVDYNALTNKGGGTGSYVTSGDYRAPIFYDSDNTAYYTNPNGNSNLYNLNVSGNVYVGTQALPGIIISGSTSYDYLFNPGTWSTSVYSGYLANCLDNWEFAIHDSGTRVVSPFAFFGAANNIIMGRDIGWGTTYIQAAQSFRAPIFYDSDNTAYYTDPASTSNLNLVHAQSVVVTGTTTDRNVVRAIPKGASASYNNTVTGAFKIRLPFRANDMMWMMTVKIYDYSGNSISEYQIGNYSYSAGAYQIAASFFGSNNAASRTVRLGNDGSYDCVWIGETSGTWNHPVIAVTDFMGGYANASASVIDDNWDISLATSFGTIGGTITPTNRFYSVTAESSISAPIFYDSNNTGFYVDAASTSNLNAVNFNGVLAWADGTYALGSPSYGFRFNDTASTINAFIIANNGDTTAWTSSRAPIFYDRNNTAYFTDPAGRSRQSQIDFGDGGYYIHGGSWGMRNTTPYGYIEFGPANGGHAHIYTDRSNFYFNAMVQVLGGSQINQSDIRANIFYDQQDTGYYTDPNGTSRMGDIHTNRIGVGQGINASWPLIVSGNAYLNAGGYGQAEGSWRAPLFYDSNNTGYYIDPNSTSNITDLVVRGGTSVVNISDLTTGTAPIRISNTGTGTGDVRYIPMISGTSTSSSGYLQHTVLGSVRGTVWGAAFIGVGGNDSYPTVAYTFHYGGYASAPESWRAQIFYDNNDTGYYIDPNSTSRLNTTVTNVSYLGVDTNKGYAQGYGTYSSQLHRIARITFDWNATYNQEEHGIFSTDINGSYSDSMSINSFNDINLRVDSNNNDNQSYVRFHHHSTGSNQFAYVGYDGSQFLAFFSGILYGGSSARSPIFYDYDNTGFYLDPNNTSELNRIGTVRTNNFLYLDNNYGHSVVGVYSSYRYQGVFAMGDAYKLPASGETTGNLYGIAWSHPNAGGTAGNLNTHGALILENGTYLAALSGSIRCRDDMRTPIYYDSNDTGYYTDPNGTSRLNYVVPNRIKLVNNVNNEPRWDFTAYVVEAQHWYGNNSSQTMYLGEANWVNIRNTADIHGDARSPIYYDRNDTTYYADLNSTGTSIRAAGNITAYYSDMRLKTHLGKIENARDKVRQLEGFYYEANELAQSFGYKAKREVGVSAQAVQAVLPEIVTDAPINSNYLTIDYERLTPLLIEAIKEQDTELVDLRNRVAQLESLINKLIGD
jgi:hypothetical protein